MNPKLIEAREQVVKAREALRRGDKDTARDLGEKAALLTPDMEDAWLILVAADSNREDALAYAQKALELNPASPRAQKAVAWATSQLKQVHIEPGDALSVSKDRNARVEPGNAPRATEALRSQTVEAASLRGVMGSVRNGGSEAYVGRPVKHPAKKSNRRALIYAGALLGLLVCAAVGVAGWSAINNPAFASFMPVNNVAPTQEILWAQVNVPKPGVTPIDVSAFAQQPTSVVISPSPAPTDAPTLAPTDTPTIIPTETSTPTPAATETPGVMAMDIVADTPTSAYAPPVNPVAASGGNGGARWIDVNLSAQSVTAYEGDTPVNSFIVSTGTRYTPTVTGKFKIWIKFKSSSMSGPGYYLPNVPYIMYFHKGYGLHGTYWHSNFGTPMSHGCVNLRTSDAEWLYNFASVGTVVNVHY